MDQRQVDLDTPKRRFADTGRHKTVHWKRSLPFVDAAPRGVLIHRVRSACSHLIDGTVDHYSVQYWCGNFGRELKLLAVPPEGRILCERCEAMATAAGKKPADEIAGRHVHRGGVRPYRTCCRDVAEAN
jgi:hypothetical protein